MHGFGLLLILWFEIKIRLVTLFTWHLARFAHLLSITLQCSVLFGPSWIQRSPGQGWAPVFQCLFGCAFWAHCPAQYSFRETAPHRLHYMFFSFFFSWFEEINDLFWRKNLSVHFQTNLDQASNSIFSREQLSLAGQEMERVPGHALLGPT